ncbi:NAD(P)-dependent oxidoreductase [Sulfitobacter sp. G21635-S1]|uniref:NAD-dependent epimerase/dehydratase family protein n=1 Tax=Sulfitobacter sp. G21635-S1 TaxID=3014043 RepID=UPI0022AF9D36|nr:NAD(P)-dependent oxidoreductase [Sulfitobacter sp. G21635-S1]MCZ4254117.1 NAD(P)-dependent oxidoreductase [Sulfitobacter sp. G21635-S1]
MSCATAFRLPLTIGPILVTGGAGFLGRALTQALVAEGHRVVVSDLRLPDEAQRVTGATYVQNDVRDGAAVMSLVETQGIAAIVHLAALVIPACRKDPMLGAEVNVLGHINLLEAARRAGIRRLVYTSSLAARPRGPLDSPANLYGVYKAACEDISKVYLMDHGLPSVGLRPNVVYGPGRVEGETAAISLAMRAAARGERFEIPFTGRMCFQHVDEVIEIFKRCLAAQNDTAVVSDLTTKVHSIGDVLAAIRACVPEADVHAAPSLRAAPDGLDNNPLRRLLGNWKSVSLAEGTARTIARCREAAVAGPLR